MSILGRFLSNARENYRQDGISGLKNTFNLTYRVIRQIFLDMTIRRFVRRNAQNVYEFDWDVLIVLDCARVDMMEAVSNEYDFIIDIDSIYSVGGHSREWMEYTFTDEYTDKMAETLHVTANTASDRVLDAADFLHLEEVWRDGWNTEYNTILPQTVTDRAISLHREFTPSRTIIHYMQPHTPFIPFPEVAAAQVTGPGISGQYGKGIEELAEEYSREELWTFHLENLRYVLDNLTLLLKNLEADQVIISADHGQALGENGTWGHPRGSRLDCIRQVPWCITSASDTGQYDPDVGDLKDTSNQDQPELSVEEKLRYLGYT